MVNLFFTNWRLATGDRRRRFRCVCNEIGVILIATLLLASPTAAMTIDRVPNPRTAGGYVTDGAGVLGADFTALINNLCVQIEHATGAEVAVVTVDNMNGTTVEDYAVRLFKQWGIGKREQKNGALILFAHKERRIKIEVGYGLEEFLTDARTGVLLDQFAVPNFKQGLFGRGLLQLTQAVAGDIARANHVPLQIDVTTQLPAQVTPPPLPNTDDGNGTAGGPLQVSHHVPELLFVTFAALWLFFQSIFVGLAKARAEKFSRLGSGSTLPLVAFGFAAIMFLVFSNVLALAIAAAVIAISLGMRRVLHMRILAYRRRCPHGHGAMELVSESDDDQFLQPEEIAEEQASGMDYEFWRCPQCQALERFAVVLRGAARCPQCTRRTLETEETITHAAAIGRSGQQRVEIHCVNPRCTFRNVTFRTIAALLPPVSGGGFSSGGSGFSGGSFGGGSSGGGGASRGW